MVVAPATIEECFHVVVLARRLAEEFRTPVLVLTDANLATGVAPFPRPKVDPAWLAPPADTTPWPAGLAPYDWNPETGLSTRPIPRSRARRVQRVVVSWSTEEPKVSQEPRETSESWRPAWPRRR